MSVDNMEYGIGDASYQAAGQLEGITALVNAFYDFMDSLPEANDIRHMHRDNLDESRLKLAYFLSGWLGGPKRYSEHFGTINIPKAHRHLAIGKKEADAWITCMQRAVELQPYSDDFKQYLIEQLKVPAERIRIACAKNR